MPALIWLAYASLLVLGLVDNVRSPFFPEILTEMRLNGTIGSTFFATTSLFAFIGSWSAHRLAQRRSALFLMNLSSLGVGLGFACISQSHQLVILLLACALFGYAYGGLNLAQNLMVVESAPSHLRRRLFSGLHSMYGLAALLAPVTASTFRWLGMNWRQCFLSLAVLPLLQILLSLKLREPNSKGSMAQKVVVLNRREWIHCLIFSLMMAFYLWGEISISTRLVLWLRTERDFSPDLSDLYLGGFFMALLAGRIVFTFVHFKRLDNWVILLSSAGLSALLYLVALRVSPLWFVATGLSMAPFFPIAMEQVSASFQRKSAQALGFVLGFGSLSVVAMHLLIGYCTDVFGLTRALLIPPAMLSGIFLVLGGLRLSGRLTETVGSRPR